MCFFSPFFFPLSLYFKVWLLRKYWKINERSGHWCTECGVLFYFYFLFHFSSFWFGGLDWNLDSSCSCVMKVWVKILCNEESKGLSLNFICFPALSQQPKQGFLLLEGVFLFYFILCVQFWFVSLIQILRLSDLWFVIFASVISGEVCEMHAWIQFSLCVYFMQLWWFSLRSVWLMSLGEGCCIIKIICSSMRRRY